MSPHVMELNHLELDQEILIIPSLYIHHHITNSNSVPFEYFTLPNIDSLAKDLTLFGKLEFGGAMKPTDDGIPVLTDRVGALEIHNKILY